MAMQFRMKPGMTIEAMQIDGTRDGVQRIIDWVNANTPRFDPTDMTTWSIDAYYGDITIRVPEGELTPGKGDWVVLLLGKFHTFDTETFKLAFEVV